MSELLTLQSILSKLRAGYYPICDYTTRQFIWYRDEHVRFVIRPTSATVQKAQRILSESGTDFRFEFNRNFPLVLDRLMDSTIRPNSWVTEEVANVYRILHRAGLMRTVEAYASDHLVAALLGIELGRAFLAETMFGTKDNASKVCLAQMLIRERARGCKIVDVQVEHERGHPAKRLGEEILELDEYLQVLRDAYNT